jgi:hypothetical protein
VRFTSVKHFESGADRVATFEGRAADRLASHAGFLDRPRRGWAADAKSLVPAKELLVFIDGEFYASIVPALPSKHAAKRYESTDLANCGFLVPVPVSSPDRALDPEIRVFARTQAGTLSELEAPRRSQPVAAPRASAPTP